MKLSIRTNRALTLGEIKAIEEITGVCVVSLSTDFKRNNPPSFPLFKSLEPNYEIGDKSESEEYEDKEFEEMEELGKDLEDRFLCIVHTYPD